MRFFCNLLIGLPLLGLLVGSSIFLYDSISSFTAGPTEWAPCSRFLQWLFRKWNVWDSMASFTDMYCDLSFGAHIAIASFLIGCITIPIALALARRLD